MPSDLQISALDDSVPHSKNKVPFTLIKLVGLMDEEGLTKTVPASVPSLFHSS